jgi:hypothetical protein
VYALRRDGFSDDIALELKGAENDGFALGGAVIPGGADRVRLTLAAPRAPTSQPVSLVLEGRATVDGRELRRDAVPAEDMMQAFLYRHLVPSKELLVSVSGRASAGPLVKFLERDPVTIPLGGEARVRVQLPPVRFEDRIRFELSEPPEGLTIRSTSATSRSGELVLQCDRAKAKPGIKGNLIITAFAERPAGSGTSGGKPSAQQQRRYPLGTLPAVPFEIIAAEGVTHAK